MKNIVFFDMDGTLTPARKSMPRYVAEKLFILHNTGCEIALISGSDMNYILEQCDVLFKNFGKRLNNLRIFPCNGTKYYTWDTKSQQASEVYTKSMRSELGAEKLKHVIKSLLRYQLDIMNNFEFSNRMNYTGTFVDYRESLINWCPTGRNANSHDRSVFEDLDEYFKIREKFSVVLRNDPVFSGLAIKVGGTTSFDIYPHGWDKTFPFVHANKILNIREYETFFVGDRCSPGGNDYELYEYVNRKNAGNAYMTTGPEQTVEIINQIMERF
mgnify:FL=1